MKKGEMPKFLYIRKWWSSLFEKLKTQFSLCCINKVGVKSGKFYVYKTEIIKNNDRRKNKIHIGYSHDPYIRNRNLMSSVKKVNPDTAERDTLFDSGWLRDAFDLQFRVEILGEYSTKKDALYMEAKFNLLNFEKYGSKVYTRPKFNL